MGYVISAFDVTLECRVALKILRTAANDGPTATERLLREARATAALNSEHICRVVDCGVADGKPYIAMELLHGTTLAQELTHRGRLPVSEACELMPWAKLTRPA
jgi:serine/threonine protein kinase